MFEEPHDAGIKLVLWQIHVITATAESPQLGADRRALVDNGYAMTEGDSSL